MVRPTVPDACNHAVKGKGEQMVPKPPMNSAQRRKLGDITNLPNQKMQMNQGANEDQQATLLYKENAEKLQKDNIALKKVLMERNKTIELSEVAQQKLRINLQKVQEQNLQLAQRNNQMLAELNTSKDQLKVLRHKLSCKNGLLMARKIVLKEQNLPCTRNASEDKACKTLQPKGADHKNASESFIGNSVQTKEKANNRRSSFSIPQSAKSELFENGEIENLHEVIDAKECNANARVSLRKRSAHLNYQESESPESFHESVQTTKRRKRVSSRRQSPKVKESTDPPLQDDIVEEESASVSMELKIETQNKPSSEEAEVMRRPTRQAAGKIQSYREASLKEKMRRDF